MIQLLTSDDRGFLMICPKCATHNRLAFARLNQPGRCGARKGPLPASAGPVDIDGVAGFADWGASSRTISPREAFLPPKTGTSSMVMSANPLM